MMFAQISTTGWLKNYANRGSVSVLSYHQAGGGHPNQRGRGKMKVQAISSFNIKVRSSSSAFPFLTQTSFANSRTSLVALVTPPKDMRLSPPSTDPSPGTYHSYPMSTPPTTNTGVGMNVTEPSTPRFQPPPYNLNDHKLIKLIHEEKNRY
ncbi:hypothetical protein PGTUg99_002829 [Puccinia graminis f. sp. tritici]|uniref:Uncharacterized protein n=1 Tax=Puccinia graminis f. sp. tritici TaxID=56615 RepID=A0A5B0RX93_PUCGR|nr:hypothetical protein PGTUg99_002829 [Puccinia graminis f. sp. tritici]